MEAALYLCILIQHSAWRWRFGFHLILLLGERTGRVERLWLAFICASLEPEHHIIPAVTRWGKGGLGGIEGNLVQGQANWPMTNDNGCSDDIWMDGGCLVTLTLWS